MTARFMTARALSGEKKSEQFLEKTGQNQYTANLVGVFFPPDGRLGDVAIDKLGDLNFRHISAIRTRRTPSKFLFSRHSARIQMVLITKKSITTFSISSKITDIRQER